MGKSVTEILASMSLEDKVALLSGADFWHLKSKPRLGIPQVMVSDGPHGLRKQAGASDHLGMGASIPATCFPTASALASSWNRNLLRVMGEALGEECLQEEVAVLLGPGVNIKRSPLCGRNFEYFSEDPCLAGELAAAWIQGVQAMGVGASLKHFACNNQEELRMTIEAVVDQRSLRELYLPAFETAIKKASPWTVMAAYNRLNGAFCAEQPWLLGDLLRNDWGFEGVVVTDWGACNDRFQGLVAGLDLEMPYPGPHNDRETWRELLRDPRRIEILDRTVARLLSLILKADANRRPGFRYDAEAHHALARRTAAESMVLLKNQGGLLPLAEGTKLAVIGDFAQKPRYQGAGSSLINPTRLDTVLSLIAGYTGEVSFSRGYDQATDRVDEALVAEAALAAREADVALVFVGLTAAYEMEGADRRHLRLPESHDRLVEAVAAANPKTIVVLSNGSAVELPWLEKVAAVLEAFLAGQAGAGAALDILFGRVCPSGKLAETWPLALGDLASSSYFPEGPLTVEYREGPYVGYRFFDASGKEPLFPFGFGLSYTSFAYSDFSLSSASIREGESLVARLKVTNTGAVPGSEIVQLYVRDLESTAFRPVKELKDFAKISLEPGESAFVDFELGSRAFAYWEEDLHDWFVETGDFEILAAASSADVRQTARVRVESARPSFKPVDRRRELPTYYKLPAPFKVPDAEWKALYASPLPAKTQKPGLRFTMTTTLSEVKTKWIGRILYGLVVSASSDAVPDAKDPAQRRLMEAMADYMPLRNLVAFSGGKLGHGVMNFLLFLMNIGRGRS